MPTIRVILHEVPAAHWAIGDETRDELDAAKAGTRAVGQPT
jgi:phenylpyruvate tautomerase PptA (4-oxalocrotonate tautomerase family)